MAPEKVHHPNTSSWPDIIFSPNEMLPKTLGGHCFNADAFLHFLTNENNNVILSFLFQGGYLKNNVQFYLCAGKAMLRI